MDLTLDHRKLEEAHETRRYFTKFERIISHLRAVADSVVSEDTALETEIPILQEYLTALAGTFSALSFKYLLASRVSGMMPDQLTIDLHESGFPIFQEILQMANDAMQVPNHMMSLPAMKDLKQAAVSKIVIERPHKKCRVTVHSARPGIVIGKKGADIEKLRRKVSKLTDSEVHINIVEVRKPETDAALVANSIAQQLERRVAFRRAMKRAMQTALRMGGLGIRINCSGRLGGAEIARMEWYREGRVPLHTLRADIDYGVATARTTYGAIGIKVWIFKGEIMEHDPMASERRQIESAEQGGGGQRRRENA